MARNRSTIANLIYQAKVNPTKSAVFLSIGVGIIGILVLLVYVLNAFHVFGGGDTSEQSVVAIGSPVQLAGGALTVEVTGVQKRPLSTFRTVTPEDDGLVAIQVDMRVTWKDGVLEGDKPEDLSTVMVVDPAQQTVLAIQGRVPGEDKPGEWYAMTDSAQPKDGTVYDLYQRPLPVTMKPLSGSIVFAVPFNAEEISLVLADYGTAGGGKGNKSGMPKVTWFVPLDSAASDSGE